MSKQFGLGRGLSSLIPPKENEENSPTPAKKTSSAADEQVLSVPVENIRPNPHQPRLEFDREKLRELADSIAAHGLLQPLTVTEKSPGVYELVAGERRWRAAKLAGLTTVPVLVKRFGEREKMELAVIENIQRQDLNLIEEARAYRALMDKFDLSQEELARRLGKSRSALANRLRLLSLPVVMLKALSAGTITEGHAKVILSLPEGEARHALFEAIVSDRLSVRQAQARAETLSGSSTPKRRKTSPPDPQIAAAEKKLTEVLGTKVSVQSRSRGGKVVIEYYDRKDLQGLIDRLSE